MDIIKTKNGRFKLWINNEVLKSSLTYLPLDKLYLIYLFDKDLEAFKKCRINDCSKEIIYDITYEKPYLDTFFDNVELQFENEKFHFKITTKNAVDDDLRHDKFTRKALLESLVNFSFIDGQFDKEVHYYHGIKSKGYSNLSILYYPTLDETIECSLTKLLDYIKQLSYIAVMALNESYWDERYLKDESLFVNNLVLPLLRKMKFLSIQHNHGAKEFGKDIVFSKIDEFGFIDYYGIQVKAGNISGKVNSSIDELIGQINDSFLIPYKQIGIENNLYINAFYIIISGRFSENAREKLLHKMNPVFKGSVKFIDKDKILELIYKYWK